MASEIPDDTIHAQVLITCVLCPEKAELICKSCDVKLCRGCAGQHMVISPAQEHRVIKYSKKYDFFLPPFCLIHHEQKCKLHCQQCAVPICFECVSTKTHKEHNKRIYRTKKDLVEEETRNLEDIILPKYKRSISEIEENIANLHRENASTKLSIREQSEKFYEKVKNAFDDYPIRIDEMEKNDIIKLKRNLTEFQKLAEEVQQRIQKNKELVKSEDEIINYEMKLQEEKRIPSKLKISPPSFTPGKTDVTSLLRIFGKLEPSRAQEVSCEIKHLSLVVTKTLFLGRPLNSEVTQSFTSNFCKVCCLKKNKAWVLRNGFRTAGNLSLLDRRGEILDEIEIPTQILDCCDITVSENGDLFYSSSVNKSINLVKNGKITEVIKTRQQPRSFCFTSSNDLLVNVVSSDLALASLFSERNEAMVLKYTKKASNQQIQFEVSDVKICHSSLGRCPLLDVTENKNGDICIADYEGKKILIYTSNCMPRSTYTGTPYIQNNEFCPRHIITDSQGHILVTALAQTSYIIHILDKNGELLSFIDNANLADLTDVSIDDEDNIWLINDRQKLIVLKYLQ